MIIIIDGPRRDPEIAANRRRVKELRRQLKPHIAENISHLCEADLERLWEWVLKRQTERK